MPSFFNPTPSDSSCHSATRTGSVLHCPPLSRDQAIRQEGVRVTFLNADGTLLNADGTLSVILSEAKNLSNLERE